MQKHEPLCGVSGNQEQLTDSDSETESESEREKERKLLIF